MTEMFKNIKIYIYTYGNISFVLSQIISHTPTLTGVSESTRTTLHVSKLVSSDTLIDDVIREIRVNFIILFLYLPHTNTLDDNVGIFSNI